MDNNMVQVYHDPFGRFSIMRELIHKDDRKECSWCCNIARFKYYIEPDSIYNKLNEISGEYCSIVCMRLYHGIS